MSGDADEWLHSGRGVLPTLRWSFTADAPLTDLRLARESGEVLIADISGGMYLLDRRGRVLALIRTRHEIQRVHWCDTGLAGVAALDNQTLGWFDRKLQFDWTRDVGDDILAITMDPHGTHVAVSTADGVTTVYSSENRKVSRFETIRPLRYISLLTTVTHLVGAAEHGLVGRFALRGEAVWSEKLWSNVGDLTVTGDGRHVFLAGFAHGIQAYNGESGKSRGTFITEGTVSLVSCGYSKENLVAATLERVLFALDDSGTLKWSLTAPEDISRVCLAPLADSTIAGFASGRVVRLDFNR